MLDEIERLRQQAQFAGLDVKQFQQAVVVRTLQVPEIDLPSAVTEGHPRKAKDISKGPEALPTPATNTIPFLSPLPLAVSISSPVSSCITFAPLPDDVSGSPSEQQQIQLPTPPAPMVEPIPFRHRAPLLPSGLSRTRPLDLDPSVDQGLSRSLPAPSILLSL